MGCSTSLHKEDIEKAVQYLNKVLDTELSHIIANPIFDKILFETGINVPIEYDETEVGILLVGEGEDGGVTKEEIKLRYFDPNGFKLFQEVTLCDSDNQFVKSSIHIWKWEDAPPCFKQFSEQGGDEDWVFVIPPAFMYSNINWLDHLSWFNQDTYFLPDGWQVVIISH